MSPADKPVDIYVRVSRVNGREGDSFISPAEQEKRCRAQLEADGYEVGQVFVDLDESGATQDRPAFNEAMRRVEGGESGGLAVLRLSRFGRTTRGVLDDVSRIEAAGGVFLAVEEKLDTSTSIGRFVLRMFASLAELELDRIREGWAATHANMVERGVQSGRPPSGYDRNGDKRLAPNGDADVIREAFRLRANENASWADIARFLTDRGIPTRNGKSWSRTSAKKLIQNRVYLGEARHGELVNSDAHEPLVDTDTFARANRRQGETNKGGPGSSIVGGGLLRCAVCGSGMVMSSMKTTGGRRYEFFRCPMRDGEQRHATIARSVIEPYLLQVALERIELAEGEYVGGYVDPEIPERLGAAIAGLENLESDLENNDISPTAFAKAATMLEREIAQLREAMDVAPGFVSQVSRRAQADRDAARALLIAILEPELGKHVPKEVPNARRLLRETIGAVTVHPGRAPVEERVSFE